MRRRVQRCAFQALGNVKCRAKKSRHFKRRLIRTLQLSSVTMHSFYVSRVYIANALIRFHFKPGANCF